jgi:hypothetical protein
MATLKWVFLAKIPLSVDVLCHALGVRPNDKTLDLEGLPSGKSILDCCLGLVTLYDARPYWCRGRADLAGSGFFRWSINHYRTILQSNTNKDSSSKVVLTRSSLRALRI